MSSALKLGNGPGGKFHEVVNQTGDAPTTMDDWSVNQIWISDDDQLWNGLGY
jgi:hypothetical protein